MVSFLEAVILSFVQGIAEWFPISSSGHLALLHEFFGYQNLSYDVFLHFASLFAVVIIFWKDIIDLIYRRDFRYIGFIILAVVPAFLFGVLLRDYIVNSFSSLLFLGLFFIFSGIVIYSTKYIDSRNLKIGFVSALFVGIVQVFALFPGVSRSGMTISGGLFAGLKKEEAIKFSFLLSIPVILGASLAEASQIFSSEIDWVILGVSFAVTFLVSLVVIKLLLGMIRRGKFWWFGVYNMVLGVGVLILSLIG